MSQIRADNITNRQGTGAPIFVNGIRVTGLTSISDMVANTGSFTGAVSIGGTLTYEDVTNIDSVGLITARSGVVDSTLTSGRILIAGASGRLTDNNSLKFDGSRLDIDSSAQNVLQINSTNSDGPSVPFQRSGTNMAFLGSAAAAVSGGTATDFSIRSEQNLVFAVGGGSERLRIGTAGQIGIGGANYGSSGQVLTSQGASAAPQWATPSGGLSMSDWWYLRNPVNGTAVQAVYNGVIMGDWASSVYNLKWFRYEEQYGVGHVGAAMTVSSAGVFTFPTTGVYKIHARLGWPDGGTTNQRQTNSIQSTTDGSSFNNVASGNYTTAAGDSRNSAEIFLHSFNVTNTATHKIRLRAEIGGNNFWTYDGGSGNYNGAYYGVYKFMSFQKIN